ncbi:hypothetical protein ACJX0J_025922 [Zea mays]
MTTAYIPICYRMQSPAGACGLVIPMYIIFLPELGLGVNTFVVVTANVLDYFLFYSKIATVFGTNDQTNVSVTMKHTLLLIHLLILLDHLFLKSEASQSKEGTFWADVGEGDECEGNRD